MRYLIIFLGVCTIVSCTKSNVAIPQFDVSLNNKNYKAGDTVVFKIQGNPDNITFYSGMSGNNYDNAGRTQADGVPGLNFTTTLANAGEANTLKILASTNFNGVYTADNVQNATWTDITSRALLATSATAKASGNVNLSDFITPDNKPLFIAFRYLGYDSPTLKQPKWALTTFVVDNILPDGTDMAVSPAAETGWLQVDLKNNTTQWNLPATGLISIDGTTAVAGVTKSNSDNDDWAITKPLNLKKAAPDVGVSIKNMSATPINTYSFVYTKAGTYKVAFVGFNINATSRQEIVKQLSVTIN